MSYTCYTCNKKCLECNKHTQWGKCPECSKYITSFYKACKRRTTCKRKCEDFTDGGFCKICDHHFYCTTCGLCKHCGKCNNCLNCKMCEFNSSCKKCTCCWSCKEYWERNRTILLNSLCNNTNQCEYCRF